MKPFFAYLYEIGDDYGTYRDKRLDNAKNDFEAFKIAKQILLEKDAKEVSIKKIDIRTADIISEFGIWRD